MKKVIISHGNSAVNHIFIQNLITELINHEFEVIGQNKKSTSSKSRLEEIQESNVLLAFLDDFSTDVIFEVGYAYGIGTEVIIVAPSNTNIPAALLNARFIKQTTNQDITLFDIIVALKNSKLSHRKTNNSKLDFATIIDNVNNDMHYLESISTQEFEGIVVDIFDKLHLKPKKLQFSRDQGFDIELYNIEEGKRTLVEIKKYNTNHKISMDLIVKFQETLFLNEADKGIFITTSEYTSSARELANMGNPKIELLTFNDLINLFKEQQK
ncbi:restriction endonuclease [Paenibacillus phytohabitans]|uniref:restriction endonuclease n=1 Tax=Paenibacillus phytohabitans TaxID=2654978 RepID=UPI00300BABCC